MNALVTGITGFAGGFLAEHCLAQGDRLLGTSRHGTLPPHLASIASSGPAPTQGPSPPPAEPIETLAWDLTSDLSPAARARIAQFAPECIYHLAALSVPGECGRQAPTEMARQINIEGTARVLELAAALESRPRVLVISSSHVYAPVTRAAPRVGEDAPLGPHGGYGQTKLAAERLAAEYHRQHGLDTVVVRAFQHTGPRQNEKMMLPQWAQQFALWADRPEAARRQQPVVVRHLRSWIDVTDVRDTVRAYRLLAERAAAGSVYNVGSGVCRSSGEVVELLRRVADPLRPIHEEQPVEKQDPIADISRLARCTDWAPVIPLEQTVADTYAYWRSRIL